MNTGPIDTLLLSGILMAMLAMLAMLVHDAWRHR